MATRTGLCLFVVWVCACSSLLQSLPEGDNLLITVNFKTFSVRGPATLKNNYLNRLCAALQCSYSQAVLPLWSSRWSRAVLLFVFLVTFCSPTTKSCDFFTVVFFYFFLLYLMVTMLTTPELFWVTVDIIKFLQLSVSIGGYEFHLVLLRVVLLV